MHIDMKELKRGFLAGFPIGLGYLSVSITFGIMGISSGLTWWQTLLISMTTLTSAGQLAALGIMVFPGQYLQMLIAQLTINIRYCFMSISLSQIVDEHFTTPVRSLLAFSITDEIFAVGSQEKPLNPTFWVGLSILPYIGWASGTLFGALLGSVLPEQVMTALGIAIYGMFIAIIVPEIKVSRPVMIVCIAAAALACAFKFLPVLNTISPGLVISFSAIGAAAIGAFFFPIEVED